MTVSLFKGKYSVALYSPGKQFLPSNCLAFLINAVLSVYLSGIFMILGLYRHPTVIVQCLRYFLSHARTRSRFMGFFQRKTNRLINETNSGNSDSNFSIVFHVTMF